MSQLWIGEKGSQHNQDLPSRRDVSAGVRQQVHADNYIYMFMCCLYARIDCAQCRSSLIEKPNRCMLVALAAVFLLHSCPLES